jgi:hypothetical protein
VLLIASLAAIFALLAITVQTARKGWGGIKGATRIIYLLVAAVSVGWLMTMAIFLSAHRLLHS